MTSPPIMTNTTFSMVVYRRRGSPCILDDAGEFPFLDADDPIGSPKSSAAFVVPACKAAPGLIPFLHLVCVSPRPLERKLVKRLNT